MRQFAGFGTAEQTNERYKFLIEHGQTGLSVAFSLHTIYGIEATDQKALGEVGKEGVAIDTLKDMETLFDGIDLSKISTSMTINAPASILLAMYIVTAENQGHTPEQLRGTIQNDILKEYMAQKSWIFPPGDLSCFPRSVWIDPQQRPWSQSNRLSGPFPRRARTPPSCGGGPDRRQLWTDFS